APIAKQRLSNGLDDARLAGPRRSQEEEIPDWAAGRIQPRQKHLINFADFLDSGILAYDPAPESGFKFLRVIAALRGIQYFVQSGFQRMCHFQPSKDKFLTPTNVGPDRTYDVQARGQALGRARPSGK